MGGGVRARARFFSFFSPSPSPPPPPTPHPPPTPQYLVKDVLRAKCDAPIRVEVIDRATGLPAPASSLAGCAVELAILDGNAYDARCLEAGAERGADLDAAALLHNNRGAPLLATGGAAAGGGAALGAPGAHAADGRVVLPLVNGVAMLPDLHVTDSSEALLSGRKPPFRLLARAVWRTAPGGGAAPSTPPPARHAVSEGFVVATRRTRTAGKVEIPNVDDHVSKLEHMGKETVKKLADIVASAAAAGVDVRVPESRIESVGQFRALALAAERDGHLRQKLQHVLKLSKEKWDDARDHALRAVVADGRVRVWYAGDGGGGGDGRVDHALDLWRRPALRRPPGRRRPGAPGGTGHGVAAGRRGSNARGATHAGAARGPPRAAPARGGRLVATGAPRVGHLPRGLGCVPGWGGWGVAGASGGRRARRVDRARRARLDAPRRRRGGRRRDRHATAAGAGARGATAVALCRGRWARGGGGAGRGGGVPGDGNPLAGPGRAVPGPRRPLPGPGRPLPGPRPRRRAVARPRPLVPSPRRRRPPSGPVHHAPVLGRPARRHRAHAFRRWRGVAPLPVSMSADLDDPLLPPGASGVLPGAASGALAPGRGGGGGESPFVGGAAVAGAPSAFARAESAGLASMQSIEQALGGVGQDVLDRVAGEWAAAQAAAAQRGGGE